MTKLRVHAALLAAASLIPGVASAQSAAASGVEAPGVLDEIIVTAQRREERLQEVPLSISVLNRSSLENASIVNSRDLTMITTGLRIESVGSWVQPAIRGITTTQTSPTSEPNVATYIDGVYQPAQLAAFFELPDVEQIEVLKGPQGTLFGRNATGGAILIHTRDPDLQERTAKLGMSYGRFDSIQAQAFASVPLIQDRVAISLTGYAAQEGGYRRDLVRGNERAGGVKSYLARAKLRVAPWEGADFVLTGIYSERHDRETGVYTNIDGNNLFARPDLGSNLVASRPYDIASDLIADSNTRYRAVSLRGEIDTGAGTLTTVTAYSDVRTILLTDADYSSVPAAAIRFNPAESNNFSQEIVYTGDSIGIAQPVIGAYYYKSGGGFDPLQVNDFAPALYTNTKTRAWAIFGEINWQLADNLKLITGLRYSWEKATARAAAAGGPIRPAILPLLGTESWDSFTPRASIVFNASDDLNIYATYSRGFKSGTFNDVGFQALPVSPETVSAYEVGLKSEPIDGLTLNFASFYYDYKDLQVTVFTQVGNAIVTVLDNAATARIYGLEAEGSWQPTDRLRFGFGATWLNARYRDFQRASANIPIPDGFGGNQTVEVDASGNHMVRAPDFSGNLSLNYEIPVRNGSVLASTNLFYSGRVYHEVANRLSQSPFLAINARLAWRLDSGLELAVYGRNLTNKAVLASAFTTALADLGLYSPPRTYGVQLNYAF